jgi:hypothetical protein
MTTAHIAPKIPRCIQGHLPLGACAALQTELLSIIFGLDPPFLMLPPIAR